MSSSRPLLQVNGGSAELATVRLASGNERLVFLECPTACFPVVVRPAVLRNDVMCDVLKASTVRCPWTLDQIITRMGRDRFCLNDARPRMDSTSKRAGIPLVKKHHDQAATMEFQKR